MEETLKPLPIGINTLSTIISENMVYVDKTEIAYNLSINQGRYFLSRPRRFGKSLFLDTLKQIFEGNKEIFKGLYIYDKWNWDKKFPVIKIDFAGGNVRNRVELDEKLSASIKIHQDLFDITLEEESISNKFNELIIKLTSKYNSNVVILIDEYDKPLLDNIENPDIAMEVREGLKNFYSVIKEQDANIQFVFVTGVSKFSKVSIFSGINNLRDLTLDSSFATICGYTQNDIDTTFKDYLQEVDPEQLKLWYNGYNFLGDPVYNPFDILLFISNNHSFRNYWFETGTPTFLIKLFKQNRYFLPDLDNIEVGEEILSGFELDRIEPTTILFQTGYLTIKDFSTKVGRIKFKLCFPNFEVKTSFSEYLITAYAEMTIHKYKYEETIYDSLMNADMPLLEKTIKRLFAGIPYRNFTNNDLLDFEGYYASVLYAFFAAINCEVVPEDISIHGQADMTIKLGNNVFVMEIKLGKDNESDFNEALKQIQTIDYAAKYTGIPGTGVYELGLIFDPDKRALIRFDWNKKD